MALGERRLSAIIAPALLAVLTLTVFGKLQDYGPESTLRRFQEAEVQGNLPDVEATTMGGLRDPYVQFLGARIREFAANGFQMHVRSVTAIAPERVVIQVIYVQPSSGVWVSVFWVVQRRHRLWLIDAPATVQFAPHSMGFR